MVNYVGDAGANIHSGTEFKDTLDGQGGADTLSGAGSHDSILGGEGNDVLAGGDGRDTLRGGLNDDQLSDTQDNVKDFLHGDEGSDFVYGAGLDQLDGGAGSDYFQLFLTNFTGDLNVDLSSLNSGGAVVFLGTTINAFESGFILFGAGSDKVRAPNMAVQVNGGGGSDTLIGGAISDLLIGGNDTTGDRDVLRGEDGNDELYGGIGDVFDGGDGTSDVFSIYLGSLADDFSLDFTGMYDGSSVNVGHGMRVVRCERGSVQLGFGDDKVDVGSEAAGNTVIVTGNGGNDTLIGGAGNDNLSGGIGNDVVKGGDGVDTANYQYESLAITIDLNVTTWQDTGGSGIDMLLAVERVNGTSAGDRITGNAEANTFEGYGGADTLIGGIGNDTLNGGSGGFDPLTDLDRLSGGAGQDVYNGGAGDDILVWSSTFHTTVAAPDQVTGLEAGDLIHLRDIDADTTVAGDQAFTIVGALSGVAGQMAVVFGGTKTQWLMDTDGDGAANGVIEALGDHTAHTEYVL